MRSLCFLLFVASALSVNSEVKFLKNRTYLLAPKTNFTAKTFWWDFSIDAEKSGKSCLKDLERCMQQDLHYEATANRLVDLMQTTPPFDLSQVTGVSSLCRKQSEKYVEDLKRFKLWALKMYDSSAKWPTGLLNGNVNQFGDFDLCLQSKNQEIMGKYCLTQTQVEFNKNNSPYLLALHRMMQSHFHFKNELDDPAHRVPHFSTIHWALCVPSACTSKDVELGLKNTLDDIAKGTDLQIKVQVQSEMCQTSKTEIPQETVIVSLIFVGIVAVAVSATLYDFHSIQRNDWILAFSLRKNWNSFSSLKKSGGDLEAIHGIRFLNAYLLLLAHKSMAMIFIPYVNRTEMVEFIGRPWTVLGRAASLYTDPFILISGTLTAYSLFGKLKKTGKINIVEEYSSRLFRIVPTLAALIAFCTFILPWINSGPLWEQVVTHHSHLCKKYWWRNLLFIHNYWGFNEMCLTHTHHVGIDTQLFFVAPLFVWLLWKWPRRGAYALATLAFVSTLGRFYTTYTMELSNYIHFGTTIKQLFATANNMYTLAPYRSTVYIMGIFLGYILRNFRNESPLTKTQIRIGSYLAFVSFVIAFFGPAFMGDIDYTYNPMDAALYAAFSPIFWCFTFAWFIYSSHMGYSGFWQRLFSWRYFAIWTKISYTVYLVQFPIFFYNVGVTRSPQYYGFFSVLLNLQEQVWVFFLAVCLTLFIELPFQNVRNLVFKRVATTPEIIAQKKVS